MRKTMNKILDFFVLDIINAYKKISEPENISLNKKNEEEIYDEVLKIDKTILCNFIDTYNELEKKDELAKLSSMLEEVKHK